MHITVENPKKKIKKRYEDDLIGYLQRLKWRDWPAEKITEDLEFYSVPI